MVVNMFNVIMDIKKITFFRKKIKIITVMNKIENSKLKNVNDEEKKLVNEDRKDGT